MIQIKTIYISESFIITEGKVTAKRNINAVMDSWKPWSQCSISCLGQDGVQGTRSRSRSCLEAQNEGITCNQLNSQNVSI